MKTDNIQNTLTEIQRLDNDASPGPWEHDPSDSNHIESVKNGEGNGHYVTACEECQGYVMLSADAEFTAYARTALPLLAKALEEVTKDCQLIIESAEAGLISVTNRPGVIAQAKVTLSILEEKLKVEE